MDIVQRHTLKNNYGRCRCCLEIGYHQNNCRGKYDEILKECLHICLATDARLTQLICDTCVMFLREVQKFRESVTASQLQLLSNIDKETVFVDVPEEEAQQNDLNMKKEMKSVKIEIEFDDELDPSLCADKMLDVMTDNDHEPTLKTEFDRSGDFMYEMDPLEDAEPEIKCEDSDTILEKLRQNPFEIKVEEDDENIDIEENFNVEELLVEKEYSLPECTDAKRPKKTVNEPQPKKRLVKKETQKPCSKTGNKPPYREPQFSDEIIQQVTAKAHLNVTCETVLRNTTACPYRPFKSAFYNFKCFYCLKLFKGMNMLRKHTVTHSPGEVSKLKRFEILQIDIADFKCRICGETLINIEYMIQHMDQMHGKIAYNECIEVYKEDKELESKNAENEVEENSESSASDTTSKVSGRKHLRQTCDIIPDNTNACPFRRHKSWVQCFYCRADFMDMNLLRQHMTEHPTDELMKIKREIKEKNRKRNRDYQRAWRQRNKDLKKKVSKEEKEEEKRKRHRENQRVYYQRTKSLKENDKNVAELSVKKLDDLQMKRNKLDSNEDLEDVVQCRASQRLENLKLEQNPFLTQLRIYEESHECITPKVILHRKTDIPGDGNCLFHSLIHVLKLQILTCDLRRQLRDSPYLNSCHNPQLAYNILSSNNEYGDLDCLYLFAKNYNQNICVHCHYFNVISKNEDTRFCHFKANDTHNWIHLDLREPHFTPYLSDDEKKKEDERKQKQKNKEYSKRYRDKKRISNLQTGPSARDVLDVQPLNHASPESKEEKEEEKRKRHHELKQKNKEYSKRYRDKKRTSNLPTCPSARDVLDVQPVIHTSPDSKEEKEEEKRKRHHELKQKNNIQSGIEIKKEHKIYKHAHPQEMC